ncbi:MAG: GWxTD domain-containing protein [Ignavibacteriaceae bacterium]
MKNKILLFVFIAFTSISFAQENKNLFDFDYAQFAYDSSSNYVEFYYSFNQQAMTVKTTDSLKYINGILKLSLEDTASKKFIINKEWKINHQVGDSSNSSKNLVGILDFAVPKGIYKCIIGVTDLENDKNKKTITDFVKVNPFGVDSLALSDIQLASMITDNSPDKNSIFYKNTFEVTPIPTLVFGENLPVAYYYYEVYNRLKNNNHGVLKLNCVIQNNRGNVLYNRSNLISDNIGSRVEVGAVPIVKFPTDTYLIKIVLIDSAENFGVISSKRFFVYNPNIKIVDTITNQQSNILSSIFGVMSQEECDDLFAKAEYIATNAEIDQYKKLTDVNSKRDFLFQFWKKRNPNPSSSKNEYFQEYLKHVQESNQKYGSFKKPGWKTDRGRVLIMYGEPSEIDRYPNQTDTKPYEIWHYNDIEGGVIFVFADLTGFSDYQLINSTKRGEMSDDNWQQRIATN